jgi:adenylate cyclase
MLDRLRAWRIPLAVGALSVAIVTAIEFLMPASPREAVRELGFDLVLAAVQQLQPPSQTNDRVVVVDIDRRSLESLGHWPWPRTTVARLINAIAAAKPAVVAIDVLFAEPDARSPAALARRLGDLTARSEFTALAETLGDGDKLLAQAESQTRTVLGFVLDPHGTGTLLQVPVVTRGTPHLDALWSAAGAVAPLPQLLEQAAGLGALSLPADSDGIVRYVPVLVEVAGKAMPGLALEAVRVAHSGAAYLLQSSPPVLATADLQIPLRPDGLLRLLPLPAHGQAARTLSAIDVIEQKVDAKRLAGAIVLVGSSAPELGGLRETVWDPLTPSVQIQASAIDQMEQGRFPRPPERARWLQVLLVFFVGLLALTAGAALSPLRGALALVAVIAITWVAAIAAALAADRLIDPLTPSLAGLGVFAATSITAFAVTHRREVLVRRRFEQHLAPAVVRRIVEHPGLVKLTGERREVTSLFSDVEGFTAMTHRADPEQLVDALDHYFEGISRLVVEHGGMVDKIVGDAVHALFNAPLDLDEHTRHAVACAVAMRSWTAAYRKQPGPAALGFGRTRIGIETGSAIVGDVGLQSKLDYTAYGDAVNAAARFEAANKDLGSSICIGPAAAARLEAKVLRPLGTIGVRGRSERLAVHEPWPDDAPSAWRERYHAAFALIESNPNKAAALFDALAAERLDDPVPRIFAERIRSTSH